MTETPRTITCLLLEDSDLDSELLEASLQRELGAMQFRRVTDEGEYEAALRAGGFDLILSDYRLPGFDGMRALDLARAQTPHTPFIFVSGVLGEEIAVDSLRRGATDYVLKHRLQRLPAAVQRALAEAEERRQLHAAQETQRLLVAELSHRVKNMLATVQSLAYQTLQGCESLDAFRDRFSGRLIALAEAHGLIFANDWQSTMFEDIVARILRPFGERGRHWHAEGPPLSLPPKHALALALILHEMGNNAVRHGALSARGGRMALRWSVKDGRVELIWEEDGGPPVGAPKRRGFGTKLLERSARHELDGIADVQFHPEGLRATIDFPLPA